MIESEENVPEPAPDPPEPAPDEPATESEIVELDHYFKKGLGGREDETER